MAAPGLPPVVVSRPTERGRAFAGHGRRRSSRTKGRASSYPTLPATPAVPSQTGVLDPLLPARGGSLVRPQQAGEEHVAEADLCFDPLHATTQGVVAIFLKVVR